MYNKPNWAKFEQAFGLMTHIVHKHKPDTVQASGSTPNITHICTPDAELQARVVMARYAESGSPDMTRMLMTNYEIQARAAARSAAEAIRTETAHRKALEHIKQLQGLHSAKVAASTYQKYMAARRALSELRTTGPILPLKGIDMNPQQAYSAQQVPPTPVGPVVYRYTNKMHPNYKAQGQVVFKAPADNLHKSGRTTGRILVALGTAIQQGAAVMYDHQNGYTNMHDLAALVLSTADALGLRYIECRPQQSLGRVAIRCEILDAT